MVKLKSGFYRLIMLCFSLILAACSGNGSSPAGSSNATSLGTLPNGSTVYVSQSTFTAESGSATTGTIGLSAGVPGVSYTLSFSVSPSGPSVTSTPTPCTIISGSGNTCLLSFNALSATPGTYTVSVAYIQNFGSGASLNNSQIKGQAGTVLPGTISFVITSGGGGTVVPGTLFISPLTESIITMGESTTATVSLTGSQNVTTPVAVTISSNESTIMSTSPASCNLTTSNNSCSITLTASSVNSGIATFSATAASPYGTLISESLTVTPLSAMIIIESAILNPVANSGSGSSGNQFYVESASPSTQQLTLTYINNGNLKAESFFVESSLLSTGYTIAGNTCTGLTLESGGTTNCSLTLSVATTTAGTQNLSLESSSLYANYTTTIGSTIESYESQAISWNSQESVYLSVYNVPVVNAYFSSESTSLNIIESIPMESTFYLYYTLSGGYAGQVFTYTPTLLDGMESTPSNGCQLNAIGSLVSCVISVTSGSNPQSGSIVFGVSNNGVSPEPESAVFTVSPTPSTTTFTTGGLAVDESIVQGNSFTILATMNDSNIPAQTITYNDLSSFGIVVTESPSPCTLQTTTLPYAESCTFIVTPTWNLATPNIYNLVFSSTSSTATLSPESVSFVVYQPTVYLQQSGESPGSPVTALPGYDGYTYLGIPWAYVTSGPTTPPQRFSLGTGAESNCITDNLTGLMWSQNANLFESENWANALNSVESMDTNPAATGYNLCGHVDWRLPNINELYSLINDGYTDGSGSNQSSWLSGNGFTNINNNTWSSTTNAQTTTKAWYLNDISGVCNLALKTNATVYVWPVRGGN